MNLVRVVGLAMFGYGVTFIGALGVAVCGMFTSHSVDLLDTPHGEVSLSLLPGKAIDVFSRFGFLNLGVRVLPGRGEGKWTFREPTVDAFQNVSVQCDAQDYSEMDLNYKYCENVHSLLRAFFVDFSLERLEEPWKAFVSGWPKNVIAQELGIDTSFLHDDYCYTLARVSRIRSAGRLRSEPGVPLEALRVASQLLEFGNHTEISNFISKYGSHYIRSYATGNSIYQVSVYSKDACRALSISNDFLDKKRERIFQKYAVHVGEIKVASDNKTVEIWTRSLQKRGRRPVLLRLQDHLELRRQLHVLLGDEAVLRLHLDTLSPVFQNDDKRRSFSEVIDNYLKLWDTNV